MSVAQKDKKPAKKPHSRPCDACAVRRVRCDIGTSTTGKCTNCTNHAIQCTNIRIRQKSGPKKIQQKTRQNIEHLITTGATPAATTAVADTAINNGTHAATANSTAPLQTPLRVPSTPHVQLPPMFSIPTNRAFSLKQLIPYFEIYHTWFYGIWPVMSIQRSVAKLRRTVQFGTVLEALDLNGPPESYELFVDENNAQEYALCCALCAMIARYHNMLKSTDEMSKVENCPDAAAYAQEARRIIFEYQLKSNPDVELLLTSFFLHKYHSNTLGEQQKGLIYLRESVSLAHILMLHDPETLIHQTPLDGHRHKKIYYLLLVTERFISFETNLPVLLEPTIPIPDQDFEDYPEQLYGFISLCRIFSATDKQFYVELHTKVLKTDRTQSSMLQIPETNILQDFLQNHSNDLKKQWLIQLQQKLEYKMDFNKISTDAQKVNVMISKAWLQSLGWLIASENFLINPNAQSPPMDDCFSVRFPLKIAQDFLYHVKGLPDFAFLANGPDVSVKLLEIADSLYTFTIMSTDSNDTSMAYDQLQVIYSMVLRYKANLDLPRALFSKISGLLESQRMAENQRLISHPSTIDLLDDEEDELNVFEERVKQNSISPPMGDLFHVHDGIHMRSSTSSSMASSVPETRTQSVSSMSMDDERRPKMEFTTDPSIPTSGYAPSGFTPSVFTPSGFLTNTGLTPSAGGLSHKTPSSATLNQLGVMTGMAASLSPFYIPGAQ